MKAIDYSDSRTLDHPHRRVKQVASKASESRAVSRRSFGYRFVTAVVNKFQADDCFNLSLSISFVFLMSIIPFTTLSILIFEHIRGIFFAQAPWGADVAQLLADEITYIIPFVSEQWVKTHVIYASVGKSFKAMNYFMLPLISGLLFKTLETSYRRIFQLPSRHLLLGQVVYILMSVFTVLLFFVVNFSWLILSATLPYILDAVHRTRYVQTFSSAVMPYLSSQPVSLASALVAIAFYLVSVNLFLNIKIKWHNKLFSSIVFCLLWMLAREFFGFYIRHVSEVSILYGSLSSVVIVLIWIFYSSLALLFSVEVMFALHSGNHRR
jgi:uncharacterized BrkB/YihY/UPF0761 family membrane protein